MATGKRAKSAAPASQIHDLLHLTREGMLRSSQMAAILRRASADIRTQCASAKNEAEVVSLFETRVYQLLRELFQTDVNFEKEVPVATVRHVARGRLDSRVGAVVIEYKHRGRMATAAARDSAVAQLSNYLTSLPRDAGQGLLGLLTDGTVAQIVRIDEHGQERRGAIQPLDGEHLHHIVRSALLLDKAALTPENLVRDFCRARTEGRSIVGALTAALYEALSTAPTERSRMLFHEWQSLFKLAHDDVSKQQAIVDRREALAAALGISILAGDNQTEYRALYAMQTAFAIVVKVVALKVISAVRDTGALIHFRELADAEPTVIRGKLARLEAGEIFREMGFGNLLEGDFFAWYCTDGQWNDTLGTAIRAVFQALSHYEAQPLFQGSASVRDFFKDLYMEVIPDRVRHSLGEFYTPPWLADHVVQRALKEAGITHAQWRGVDPCCGSGTFLTAMLQQKMAQLLGEAPPGRSPRQAAFPLPGDDVAAPADVLRALLREVKGIDLNPLAVLTARINYFINIAHLVGDDDAFEIPVYLGDASYVPEPFDLAGVACVQYQIGTLEGPIDVALPRSAIADTDRFSRTMTSIEVHVQNRDSAAIANALVALCADEDRNDAVTDRLRMLADKLVELEARDWNGIWVRIIANFLTIANLGRFDIIVGNPPWIDWKNLPAGYRDRIKSLCVDRHLFSGDGITGGINLNICALIANVAADNWLDKDGTLAFLMPEPLLFQQSYEGFRRLHQRDGSRLYFQCFDDWNEAGHPFAPVQQRFLTFVMARRERDYVAGVPVHGYRKQRVNRKAGIGTLKDYQHTTRFDAVRHIFEEYESLAMTARAGSTSFSYVKGADRVDSGNRGERYRRISGTCSYHGREGIEFYPQELFLLQSTGEPARAGKIKVGNYQNPRSKHKVAHSLRMLETELLAPLIKGVQISRFALAPSDYVVPFPYAHLSRQPLERSELSARSPLLMKYFNENRGVIDAQTAYNEKIIGKKHNVEFYALARVGVYSYGDWFVAFRDNTKWGAVVVGQVATPWGEPRRPVFQNHAVSISQAADGRFITEEEAHFICAILNAPVVGEYLRSSSDSRSFKIRPPIKVPQYVAGDPMHRQLCQLSRRAHAAGGVGNDMAEIDAALDSIYLALLARDGTPDYPLLSAAE